jgi:hypothetical protein
VPHFSTATRRTFGPAFTHGPEVSALLVAGQEADLVAQSVLLRKMMEAGQAAPGREHIVPAPALAPEAVALPSKRPMWKTIVLTRFDITRRTKQVRYVMHDGGSFYSILTDDPDCFLNEHGNFIEPSLEKTLDSTTSQVQQYEVLFELCASFLYLPFYFDKYGTMATEERRRTQFGENRSKSEYRDTHRLCPPEERIAFRRVTVIAATGDHLDAGATYLRSPQFRVEKTGYWRRLPPDRVGTDPSGRLVHGRTWVEKRLSWTESDSPAMLALASSRDPGTPKTQRMGVDPGWIYVMRSAAHPRNVFKIGLTRRDPEARAKELSSHTGAPDRFHVVNEWPAMSCGEAESRIHAQLAEFRVAPAREFFDLPLQQIVRVITDVISGLDGEQ